MIYPKPVESSEGLIPDFFIKFDFFKKITVSSENKEMTIKSFCSSHLSLNLEVIRCIYF